MQLTINGNKYDLYFGFDFIDYINKVNSVDINGKDGLSLKLNGVTGMKMLSVGIDTKAPTTLRTIIKGATNTLKSKPSNEDIEIFINDLLENDKYDDLFIEIVEELGKHFIILREMGITREAWNTALEELKNATK